MIDVLELAASFDEQRQYQQRATFVSVPNEVINQWDDWINGDISWLVPPVFTHQERDAAANFNEILTDVSRLTPNPLPELAVTQALPQWARLRDAAAEALRIFSRRGRLSEELAVET